MGASQHSGRSSRGTPANGRAVEAASESSRRRFGGVGRWSGLYSACDRATEWLIYFMVVFSPWAFGTTQAWSVEIMNDAGYLLGVLLATK